MKIIFFGTPEYVIPIVETLHKTFKSNDLVSPIEAVVTQPPKPSGRNKELSYSAVDKWAHKHNIQKIFDVNDLLKGSFEAEIAILAAYGEILPKSIISYFPKGVINIHPSLLPKYRGASPIQAALAMGETTTGVTFMKMDEQMDHGPIISQFKEQISPNDTLETLRTRVFERSAEVIKTLLPAYLAGKPKIVNQNHNEATFTRLVRKNHGYIPWNVVLEAIEGRESNEVWEVGFVNDLITKYSPGTIYNVYRALTPWPGIWTKFTTQSGEIKRLKLLDIELTEEENGSLIIKINQVQLEGKNESSWKQFKEAYL